MGAHLRMLLVALVVPFVTMLTAGLMVEELVAIPYVIPTSSMAPTIAPHDRIIVNRLAFLLHEPRRGDVIVFHAPQSAVDTCESGNDRGTPFVKRVVGVPGDRVEVRAGTTFVNGETFAVLRAAVPDYEIAFPEVPAGSLLVMGDNRNDSCDSHLWYPSPFVPQSAVIGRAELSYWPLGALGSL